MLVQHGDEHVAEAVIFERTSHEHFADSFRTVSDAALATLVEKKTKVPNRPTILQAKQTK